MSSSVATLVLLAGKDDDDEGDFQTVLRHQIKSLRDQLDKDSSHSQLAVRTTSSSLPRVAPSPPPFRPRDPSALGRLAQSGRFWSASALDYHNTSSMPGALPDGASYGASSMGESRRDVRSMAMAAAALGRSFVL